MAAYINKLVSSASRLHRKSFSASLQRCYQLSTETGEPPIPDYYFNPNESVELKRSRLVYQSRKRGMLENDLLLGTFAGKYLSGFTQEQLQQYDILINLPSNDWDLYYWVTGVKETPPEYDNEVMNLLKKHSKNESKEARYRQPDLY